MTINRNLQAISSRHTTLTWTGAPSRQRWQLVVGTLGMDEAMSWAVSVARVMVLTHVQRNPRGSEYPPTT
jgi:hypothetical protein